MIVSVSWAVVEKYTRVEVKDNCYFALWKNDMNPSNPFRLTPKSLPPHISLRFNGTFAKKNPHNKRRGRRSEHLLCIGINGWCSARKDGCPTTLTCRIPQEQLKKIHSGYTDLSVEDMTVNIVFYSNSCCHHKYGQKYSEQCGCN